MNEWKYRVRQDDLRGESDRKEVKQTKNQGSSFEDLNWKAGSYSICEVPWSLLQVVDAHKFIRLEKNHNYRPAEARYRPLAGFVTVTVDVTTVNGEYDS